MPISLYDATVPLYLQVLPAIGGLIDKAEAHCRDAGLPDSALSEASLAPDMWHFARQVQAVCMQSAGAVEGALSGTLTPDFTPPTTDFPSLRARVADAIARLQAVTPEQLEAVFGHDAAFVVGERRIEFTAEDFLLSFALPNFTFHATTAYAILRMKGLALSKGDFLGKIRAKPQG